MLSRTFSSRADAVPSARAFVAEGLDALSPELCQTAALLVSELATNAIRHSGAREFTVRLEHVPGEGRLWIGVSDSGPGQPVLRHPGTTSEHGRGLQLVSLLSARWGARRRATSDEKTIWFELRTATP